jgi:serine protease Do
MRDLLVAALLVCGCRETPNATPTAEAAKTAPATRLNLAVPGSFVDLVAKARPSVVGIRATQPVKSGPAAMFPGAPETLADVALGTGFLVESGGVFVLTNDHIAAASTELKVVLPGQVEVPAKVVGRDVRLDLALLSIDQPKLRGLPLGDSNDLQVGEWVVVLGNPFGDEVTASVGIASATGRESAGSLVAGRQLGYRTYLQTDARIHRGNSGGPVLDTAGQVVGVAIAAGDHAGELSFAIPINRVKEVLTPLREYGQVARGWLGVKVQPVTKELATSLAMPSAGGALVSEVVQGSPAARSALRVGDVILKFGDTTVDHRSLPWLVAQTVVGKPITVTVWRNKAEAAVTVATEKMPE